MATRICAAAQSSSVSFCIVWLLMYVSLFTTKICNTKHVYSRQELINWGSQSTITIMENFHQDHNIPADIARPAGSLWIAHFTHYVECATSGSNIQDQLYSNIKNAYRAVPLPHLGMSDHISFIPAYIPIRRRTNPISRMIQI